MEGQRKERNAEFMKEKIEEFQKEFTDKVTLFSLESSMDEKNARELYDNFESFLSNCKDKIDGASSSEIMNFITEIIHYFNVALEYLPALSDKAGDFVKFIELGVGIGGGSGGGWNSYSIQFGVPAGISLSLHYDLRT